MVLRGDSMASCYLTGMAVCPPSSLECCVVLQQCGEGILCLDAKGRVNYANLRACEVLGATADMLVGKVLFDDSHPQEDGRPSLLPLFRGESGEMLPLSPGMHQARVSSATHGDLPVNCRIAVVTLADGDLGYVVSFHDTRDQIATEERLTYLAHHDPLTELPNRRLVSERLDYEISRARRYGDGFALHLIDLDDFKGVNDRFGHPVGDKLLIALADRFRCAVRESDTVARIGGDEFAVIQVAVDDPEDAAALAAKLLSVAQAAVHLDGFELFPGVTIGVAVRENETSAEELWRHADAAMYQAKARGKNTFVVVDDVITEAVEADSRLVCALGNAIDYQQFHLVYQPQFSVDRGAIVGVEALLRWHHPEFGDVPPSTFIPLAERHRMIEPIGTWVLVEICRQARTWINAAIPFGRIAFNLSQLQLANREHFAALITLVDAAEIPWSMLEIEVTETAYFGASRDVLAMLEELQRRGVRIAIDDYGTGHSSLLALRRMRANSLKIDRAFIEDYREAESAGIIRETIALAHALGMAAIAEGIESPEQQALIERFGCDRSQGFHLGIPVEAGRLERMFFDPGLATAAENESASTARAAKEELILPWCNDYETGIAQIDLQHHRLVELINVLGKSGHGNDASTEDQHELLHEIARYVDYHFRCEEAFMARHHVVDHHVEHHQITHGSALRMVVDSLASFRDGRSTLSDLCQGLARWLESHIHAEDKMLGEQIVAINRGSTPIEAYRQAMLSAALEAR